MPSSLIIAALVVAWLVVLVPMIARKRQEIARTEDSALAARVVRSGSVHERVEEEFDMSEADTEPDTDERELDELDELDAKDDLDEPVEVDQDGGFTRPYRPGRGGFDAETAAITARARYAFRQRIVVLMLLAALGTGLAAGFTMPMLWWAHGGVDLLLVGYLTYLRRQVRIEEEIRARRSARIATARAAAPPVRQRATTYDEPAYAETADLAEPEYEPIDEPEVQAAPRVRAEPPPPPRPGTEIVDLEDEDPAFVELDEPNSLPYRRAAGE